MAGDWFCLSGEEELDNAGRVVSRSGWKRRLAAVSIAVALLIVVVAPMRAADPLPSLADRGVVAGPAKDSARVSGTADNATSSGQREASPVELTPKEIYARSSPAVATVTTKDDLGYDIGQGSGFFMNLSVVGTRYRYYQALEERNIENRKRKFRFQTAYLLTNYHVIRSAADATIRLFDGRKGHVREVVMEDERRDLAVLSVSVSSATAIATLPVVGGSNAEVGEQVYAIGSPEGMEATLSNGLITSKRKMASDVLQLQTNAAISPGSSGGPLLDSTGRVIGVVVAFHVKGQNLNFAIAASEISSFLAGPVNTREIWRGTGVDAEEDDAYFSALLAPATTTKTESDLLRLWKAGNKVGDESYWPEVRRLWQAGSAPSEDLGRAGHGSNQKVLSAVKAGPAPANVQAPTVPVLPGAESGLSTPVQIEIHPDSGVLVVRGDPQDVARVKSIIQEVERQAAQTGQRGVQLTTRPRTAEGRFSRALGDANDKVGSEAGHGELDKWQYLIQYTIGRFADCAADKDAEKAKTTTIEELYAAFRDNQDARLAEQSFNNAIRLKPDFAPSYLRFADILLKQGRFQEGLAVADKLVKLVPRCPRVYKERGEFYDKLGRKKEALADFKKAAELGPGDPETYVNLGGAYLDLDENALAAAAFQQAIDLKSGLPTSSASYLWLCYHDLGLCYKRMGKYQRALDCFQLAKVNGSPEPWIDKEISECLGDLK